MDRLEPFSQLVDHIYAAALEPRRWPQAMECLATMQNSMTAILVTPTTAPADGGYAITHGISEQAAQEWAQYVPQDPWTAAGMRQGLMRDGVVVLGQELVPDAELIRSAFYTEFLQHHGHRHLCTGVVFGQSAPGQVPVVCSLHRGTQDGPFGEDTRTIHRLVVNHLSRAIGTSNRLRDGELRLAASLQAMDRLHGALLLLGHRGEVLYANAAASRLLVQSDGLGLRSGNPLTDRLGWLTASTVGDKQLLEAEVASVLRSTPQDVRHFAHGLTLQRPSNKDPLVVRMAPLSSQSDVTAELLNAGAIVFITDPSTRLTLDPALLSKLYGITPAECRVAEAVLEGDALQALASRLHISENTAHTHLKRLFEKTDTHRQAQLVRVLMGLVQPH